MPKKKNRHGKKKGNGFIKKLTSQGYSRDQARAIRSSIKALPKDARGIARSQALQNAVGVNQNIGFNRPNETNPFGQRRFYQDENGNYVSDISASPEEQQRLDAQRQRDATLQQMYQNSIGQAQNNMSNPFDLSSLNIPAAPSQDQFNQMQQQQADQLYNTYSKPILEQQQQQDQRFNEMMASRGIPVGSELYNQQHELMKKEQGNQLDTIRANATANATQAAQSAYNRQLGLRQNAIQEQLTQRGIPFQEAQQIMNGIAGPQLPQFGQMANIAPGLQDTAGLGTSFANFANQRGIAGMNAAGGPAGPSRYGPEALAYNTSLINAEANAKAWLAGQGGSGSSSPNYGQQLGGAVVNGVTQGIGQGVGNYVTGLFGD